ncbi:putative ankyrin repeat protein [Rosellinia necatrix]|uniref:Putative ankyrin repeat protein n=1 Tax=Rosellinia necatrix TaxID=77044 RepID=A0A1W2TG57_ROSNE|nr:putative ankyrin repeat protein [Rosellinia necatrix]
MTTSPEEMGSLVDTNERRKAQNRAAQKKYRTRQKIRLELARAILLDRQHLRLQDSGERILPIGAAPTRPTSPVGSPRLVLGDAFIGATSDELGNDDTLRLRRMETEGIEVALDPSLDFGLNFEHELSLTDFGPSPAGSPIHTDYIDPELAQLDLIRAKETPGAGVIFPSPASTPLPHETRNVSTTGEGQDITESSSSSSPLPATPKSVVQGSSSSSSSSSSIPSTAPRTPSSIDTTVSTRELIRQTQKPPSSGLLSLTVAGESCSPLFTAISLGNFEMAKMLVAAGAKIDIPDSHGNTPLHQCIQQGDAGATCALLGLGANILKTNSAGDGPLHMAVEVGSEAIIRAILERCARGDPPARGKAGATNLLRRCVDARDSRNMTALHLAVSLQRMDALKILLEYGADVNIGRD